VSDMVAGITAPSTPTVRVFGDKAELASHVADRIVQLMTARQREGRRFVLGLAAGSSPRGIYAALAKRRSDKGVSFESCVTFCLDEYYPMDTSSERSFHQEMEAVLDSWDVPKENRHRLRGDTPLSEVPAHCAAYEAHIRDQGGIDFQILGIGMNGHIGFNEPGAAKESRTRLVQLHAQTRRDAARAFGALEMVPVRALTMGIGTILDTKELVLVALGEHKAAVMKGVIEVAPTRSIPASFLKTHSRAQFLLDAAAAGSLGAAPSDS
jgi:glucosamine-6-phosphate deaminase